MSHLLEMKNVVIEGLSGRRWQPIVKGVDLHLNRGEVLGLIGESGAGKSTLGLASMAIPAGDAALRPVPSFSTGWN